MLYSLHVKNLALISEQEIEFGKGLNIITGETGAGKSVIIGSVNLALGAKADKDIIRTGAEYALIEMIFGLENYEEILRVKQLGIPVEDDGTLIIQRKILPTRSICKAGGETVTVKQLRDLSNILINIHGQNDHQELLHKKRHLEILDSYAEQKLAPIKQELKDQVSKLRVLEKEFEGSNIDEKTRLHAQELASYEVKEIEEAALVEGEDDELESNYRRMLNSRKITETSSNAMEIISGESDENVSDAVSRALREIMSISSFDKEAQGLCDQLSDIDNLIGDFTHSLTDYIDSLEFDDEDFHRIEDRLNLINHLKEKYGNTIPEILKYYDEKKLELDNLSNLEAHKENLKRELSDIKKKVMTTCKKISDIRSKEAKSLSELMIKALVDLNFLDVRFEIQVRPNEENITSNGYDDVEFMISTNPGEAIRPLDQIASGGELSRIMLALKTVLAKRDNISTLIFDEIDTGISGRTAWKVSEKLGILAHDHQVILITHLPQIAAMADTHFLIAKSLSDDDKRTVTGIKELSEAESIEELARLLTGETVTKAGLENAKEMRKQALQVKKEKV